MRAPASYFFLGAVTLHLQSSFHCRALCHVQFLPYPNYSAGPFLNAAIRQLLWKEGSILCRFDKDWFRLYLQVQPYMCKHKTRTEFLSSKFIWNSQNCTTVLQSCTYFLEKIKGSRDKLIDLINLYHSERIKLFILQFVQARESYGTKRLHPAQKGAGRNGKKKVQELCVQLKNLAAT